MGTVGRWVLVGGFIWVALVGLAWLGSDGEPVCTGPLILGVDDSDPPQCDDPVAGLPAVGFLLLLVSGVATMIMFALWSALGALRRRG